MGIGQRKSKGSRSGANAKNKQYKKGHATKNRRKDIDQIQDELEVEKQRGQETAFEVDDDLPGQGQFYCTPCARHFMDAETRRIHVRSKLHKRRLKDVAQEQYTQAEAERGAGMTREVYPPAHATNPEDDDGGVAPVDALSSAGSKGNQKSALTAKATEMDIGVANDVDPDL